MRQLKALLGLAVVVAGFYVAFKVMPPYYNQLRFKEAVETEVRAQSYTNKSEDEIRNIILRHAREYDVPIRAEQIRVMRSGAELSVEAKYEVHVDLPIYPIDLKFDASAKNRRI